MNQAEEGFLGNMSQPGSGFLRNMSQDVETASGGGLKPCPAIVVPKEGSRDGLPGARCVFRRWRTPRSEHRERMDRSMANAKIGMHGDTAEDWSMWEGIGA